MLLLALAPVGTLHAQWSVTGALQTDEAARLASFSRPQRRAQFLAGRWLARRLLCQVAGGQPSDWQLSAVAGGRPEVLAQPGWQLSISHSGDWLACTVADRAVGVDIERTGGSRDIAAMAELVCHPAEATELQGLSSAKQEAALIAMWTRKEAWLKQQGAPFDLARMRQLAGQLASMGEADTLTWSGLVPGLVLSLAAERAVEAVVHWPEGLRPPTPLGYRRVEY